MNYWENDQDGGINEPLRPSKLSSRFERLRKNHSLEKLPSTAVDRLREWSQDDLHLIQSVRQYEPTYANPADLRKDVRSLLDERDSQHRGRAMKLRSIVLKPGDWLPVGRYESGWSLNEKQHGKYAISMTYEVEAAPVPERDAAKEEYYALLEIERLARIVVDAASPYVIEEASSWRALREALNRV